MPCCAAEENFHVAAQHGIDALHQRAERHRDAGEAAETDYPIRRLADGERISLGEVDLEILSTPGHTWESISVVVRANPDAEPKAVLTGDSLFIGDVGRPDLMASAGMKAEDLGQPISVPVGEATLGRVINVIGIRESALVVGVTHMDLSADPPLERYRDHLRKRGFPAPVYSVDARSKSDVMNLIEELVTRLEAAA